VNSPIPIIILEAKPKQEEDRRGVVQDKATPPRRSSPFGEPQNVPPAQETQKRHGSNQRRVRQVSGYLMPEEFTEVERMRGTGENRLQRGKVVSKLIRMGLAVALDKQHASMLEPRIEQTVNRLFEAFSNRQASFLSKIYTASKQGKLNTEDILRLAYKNDPETFNQKIQKNLDDAHVSLGDKHKNHHA
jgi:hypothetical protein